MTNFLQVILDKGLWLFSNYLLEILVFFCIASPLLAVIAQCFIYYNNSISICMYGRVKKFHKKYGSVNRQNSKSFIKAVSARLSRNDKKLVKDFFVVETNFASSALCDRLNSIIFKQRKPSRFYVKATIFMLFVIQGIMLCLEMRWVIIYLVLGSIGICALAANVIVIGMRGLFELVNGRTAIKLENLLHETIKTGSDINKTALDLKKLEVTMPSGREGSLNYLADCINQFVNDCPNISLAKIISNSVNSQNVPKTASEQEKAHYFEVLDKLKKYCL